MEAPSQLVLLMCRAKERCAAGIVETMEHFGKIPELPALGPPAKAAAAVAGVYAFRMAWLNGDVTDDGVPRG